MQNRYTYIEMELKRLAYQRQNSWYEMENGQNCEVARRGERGRFWAKLGTVFGLGTHLPRQAAVPYRL